jgi:hypothetical protein
VALWATKRFLHNGSVGSLDELLCVNGPREIDSRPVYGNGGHLFGCDTLTIEEKEAVIAYLDSH